MMVASVRRACMQGHGESSGAFGECGLSDWVQDTLDILDLAVMSQKVVVVGESSLTLPM